MRIGLLIVLTGVAISLTSNGVITGNAAIAAAKQTCTTDPYGTRTCTDNVDVPKAKTPKARAKKAPAKKDN